MLSRKFAGRQILLIDDEQVVREIGREMLEALGLTCICAEDGEQGIELYKKKRNHIEAVILDIEMPGLSGHLIFDMLKEINPELKILVISGYAKNYLEAKLFKRKIPHFMPKPFQLSVLNQKLSALFSGKNSM